MTPVFLVVALFLAKPHFIIGGILGPETHFMQGIVEGQCLNRMHLLPTSLAKYVKLWQPLTQNWSSSIVFLLYTPLDHFSRDSKLFWPKIDLLNSSWHDRGGYFYLLVFFGSDFVSWILSKIPKTFWRWKFTSIGLIWHPAKLIEWR